MLLYDRVLQHAVRFCHTTQDAQVRAQLVAAQRFEISAIVPLLGDWERDKALPIPKRPPFTPLWGEWQHTEQWPERHAWATWTIGSLLMRIPEADVAKMRFLYEQSQTQTPVVSLFGNVSALGLDTDYWTCDEFYLAETFVMLMQCQNYGTTQLHTLRWILGATAFGMRDNATVVRTRRHMPSQAWIKELIANPEKRTPEAFGYIDRFGIAGDIDVFDGRKAHADLVASDRYDPFLVPWPLLMAFALLHCRNIAQETITPPTKVTKKHLKRGHTPRHSYTVLRIDVPAVLPAHTAHTRSMPQPRATRLHVCRGHFKLLQHARFKHPGWYWWPAHWRGNPALGSVAHDYVLEPASSIE